MNYLIYSVEDDLDISRIIRIALSKQGYEVRSFYTAKELFDGLREEKPQMILLDMMLPDMSGTDILKNIRGKSIYDDVDIIIVSAKRMLMDKVDGLELGADDYIEKPFDVLELMSRVNVKYRRYCKTKRDVLEVSGIVMDLEARTVKRDDVEIELTSREFDILRLLVEKKNKVVSREDILISIWGEVVESRTVDMHVKSIRRKLDDSEGRIITTVYGIGYKVKE